MSSDVKAMALVTIGAAKTEITIGGVGDEGMEDGIEVVIPEEVINRSRDWKCDPYGLLTDGSDYEAEADAKLEELKNLVTRTHDETHPKPRRWCEDPVCQWFFADRPARL